MHLLHAHSILVTTLLAATLLAPTTATGTPLGERPPGEHRPAITDFWKREPPARVKRRQQRFRRALTLVRQGVSSGIRPRVINAPSVRLGHALLGALVIKHPKQVRHWYWYGYVSLLLNRPKLTIAAWKQVWKLAPNHWDTASMAFELGILYAKQARYAESVAVYRKGMPASFHLTTRGIMASNCAESLMALGKLRQAVALYRTSLRLRPQRNSAAWWGLMIAYDRLGLAAATERTRQQALTLDPNLRGLVGPGVFFVPTGDVHYYLALAYEGQGRIREAADRWRRYLKARPKSRWKKRVLRHQARLARIMARWKPHVYLVTASPYNRLGVVSRLAEPIGACYRRRASQLKRVPEGRLPLLVTIAAQRIRTARVTWSPRAILDANLRRCVLKSLRNRRLPGAKRATIIAVFQLERGP